MKGCSIKRRPKQLMYNNDIGLYYIKLYIISYSIIVRYIGTVYNYEITGSDKISKACTVAYSCIVVKI
jgi:hypothetical protein